MLLRYLIILVCLVPGLSLKSQPILFNTAYDLDTIIHIDDALNEEDIIFNISKNSITYLKYEQKDSLQIFQIDLKDKKINKLIIDITRKQWDFNENPRFIQHNDNYIILGLTNNVLILKKENNRFKFHFLLKPSDKIPYRGAHIMDNILVLSRCYNEYKLFKKYEKTKITTFNLNTLSEINSISPDFQGIEFTHMGGKRSNWIDSYNNRILFSQTLEYDIRIFDKELNQIGNITRKISDWKKMDSTILEKFRNTIPKRNIVTFIDSLVPYELNNISRIRYVAFADSNTILVNYFKGSVSSDFRNYYWDIYKYLGGTWVITQSDLLETFNDADEIITKQNFATLTFNSYTRIFNNKMVTCRNFSDFNPIGNTRQVNDHLEESFLQKNNPIPSFFIYEFNNN